MKAFDELSPRHRDFIANQRIFFVATAPLAADGHVNLSPKGLESFTVLGPRQVAYIDLGGSGIETHAHLRENGRLCIMFCSFEGKPSILRLYGRGTSHVHGTPGFESLRERFSAISVPVRAIVELEISRVQDSCGWGVPRFDYRGARDRLVEHNAARSQEEFMERRYATNGASIDGLPGLTRD